MCVSVQPPPALPPQPYGCTAVGLGPNSLSCLDLSLLLLYIAFLAGLVWAALHWRAFASFSKRHEANDIDREPLLEDDEASQGIAEDDGEHLYSHLEQRLRPLFYRMVRCCCLWLAGNLLVAAPHCMCCRVLSVCVCMANSMTSHQCASQWQLYTTMSNQASCCLSSLTSPAVN